MGAEEPEALIGKTDFDFYAPEFAQNYFEAEQAVLEKEQSLINLNVWTVRMWRGKYVHIVFT